MLTISISRKPIWVHVLYLYTTLLRKGQHQPHKTKNIVETITRMKVTHIPAHTQLARGPQQ